MKRKGATPWPKKVILEEQVSINAKGPKSLLDALQDCADFDDGNVSKLIRVILQCAVPKRLSRERVKARTAMRDKLILEINENPPRGK